MAVVWSFVVGHFVVEKVFALHEAATRRSITVFIIEESIESLDKRQETNLSVSASGPEEPANVDYPSEPPNQCSNITRSKSGRDE